MSEVSRNVTDDTFAHEVLERSKTVPVLVDLWAPWCGPCRALGPVLERVAAEANGSFELVKINVDESPITARELGARSIPLVVAFKDGEPVSSFLGAQPEAAVREFVAELVPSEADLMVEDALRAREQGRDGDAETILNTVLNNDVHHTNARLTLAQLLADTQRTGEALAVLAKAEPSAAVEKLRSELRLADTAGEVDLDSLQREAEAGDVTAAIAWARALHARGDTQAALNVLLTAVQSDPDADGGAARQAMLDLFNVIGKDDPLVRGYRSELAKALH